MTMNLHTQQGRGTAPEFTTPEGLHALLHRIHTAGPTAWRYDPAATALLAHTIERYRRLARKWQRDPADAAFAAFEVMRSPKILDATDPWGVVTRAVQRNIKSETMGDRLLISAARARKGGAFIDAPTRTGDRDWIYDQTPGTGPFDDEDENPNSDILRLREVITEIIDLLIGLGWPDPATDTAVDYVLSRTGDAGSLANAREILRKETDMPARFGLPQHCWPSLLRVLLGGKSRPGRPTRKGLLVRLLDYETIDTLLDDHELILEIAVAAPTPPGGTDG